MVSCEKVFKLLNPAHLTYHYSHRFSKLPGFLQNAEDESHYRSYQLNVLRWCSTGLIDGEICRLNLEEMQD
jgi:hypothetical protein